MHDSPEPPPASLHEGGSNQTFGCTRPDPKQGAASGVGPMANTDSLPLTAAMVAKMKTAEAREAYRRRKWLAEPPNGWIKSVLGLRQFSMRGLHRVQAESKLVCMALNLRRMAVLSASRAAVQGPS